MKRYISILILLSVSACNPAYHPNLTEVKPTGDPYAILNNGTRIEGPVRYQESKYSGLSNVYVNDKSYETEDVDEFQTTTAKYIKVNSAGFAWLAKKGKVELYRGREMHYVGYQSMRTGAYTNTQALLQPADYFRVGDNGPLHALKFKTLKSELPNPGPAVIADFNEYARVRRMMSTIRWIGWPATIGGIGMILTGAFMSDNTMIYSGLGLFVAGPVILSLNLGMNSKNNQRVYTILDHYNAGQ